jgi:predicted DsbA family dithiol-disulfide isomerase
MLLLISLLLLLMPVPAKTQNQTNKMKIEIWSDIACPFCYIGKHRLQQALENFEHKDDIQIVWKSFQLDPTLPNTSSETLYEMLARKKGLTPADVRQMTAHAANMAAETGLALNFDIALPVNTFDAHRLLQMAKSQGLGAAAKERLFQAYFVEGKNIADHATLAALAPEIGLDAAEASAMLASDAMRNEVESDIYESRQLRVSSVPFFLFDEKYAVSGAQPVPVFANALKQAHQKWQSGN